jgi:hypothetical protein
MSFFPDLRVLEHAQVLRFVSTVMYSVEVTLSFDSFLTLTTWQIERAVLTMFWSTHDILTSVLGAPVKLVRLVTTLLVVRELL